MKNRRVQRNVNIVAEDQWPCISPEQREKARRCLLLHSCFQLKTWKADCPLSQQDTIDNIKLMERVLPPDGTPRWHPWAIEQLQKGAPFLDIVRTAKRFGWTENKLGVLYEWADEEDNVVYVGFTSDPSVRQRNGYKSGHSSWRTGIRNVPPLGRLKDIMGERLVFREVGLGTMADEQRLIARRLLDGHPLLNVLINPLMGLDLFVDSFPMRTISLAGEIIMHRLVVEPERLTLHMRSCKYQWRKYSNAPIRTDEDGDLPAISRKQLSSIKWSRLMFRRLVFKPVLDDVSYIPASPYPWLDAREAVCSRCSQLGLVEYPFNKGSLSHELESNCKLGS